MEDYIGYAWWWYGISQLINEQVDVIKEQVTWIAGQLSDHSCCVVLFSILCIFLSAMLRWFPTSIIGKIKLVGVFFFFNAVLPGADMVTDMLNVIDLYQKNNPIWATTSLFWIFMPFLLKFFALLFIVYEGELDKKRRDMLPKKICQTVIFFPFVLPLLNTVLSLKLTMINVADSGNANQIEKIKKIAALASLYESFFESGPQLLTQIHIVLCTGEISNIQIFSMAVSFFTLTLAACKAYYVQRDFDQADPEPSLHMVLRVFPYMSVVIINSTLQWTIITGLSKGFVFLAIPLVFCSTLIVIKRIELSTITIYELILKIKGNFRKLWRKRSQKINDNQDRNKETYYFDSDSDYDGNFNGEFNYDHGEYDYGEYDYDHGEYDYYHGDHRIGENQYQETYTVDIQDKGGDCDVKEEEGSQVKLHRQIDDNPDVIQEGKEKELLKLCVAAFSQETYTMDIQDEGGDWDAREEEASQVIIDRQIEDNKDIIQEEKERELLKFCVSAFCQETYTMDIQDKGGDCDIRKDHRIEFDQYQETCTMDIQDKCGNRDDRKEEVTQITIDPDVGNNEDDKDKEERRDKCDKSYFIKAIDSLVDMAEVPEFDENHYPLKAAMTSLWVPCVVGEKDQKTFTKSAYSSLIFKTLILIISTILAFTGSYPYFIQKGTFMLFCFDNQTVNILNQLQTTSIFDTTSTFDVCKENIFECFKRNNTELDQILHICGEDDELVKKILLGFTITLFGLALLATYCLNNLSSYITLYDVSKTFMWIPIKWVDPIFHRNLVFQIVGEMKFKKLRDLEDNDSCLQALNRQNSHGQSPLNVALENKDYNSVAVLLKKGAKIETDSRAHPLSIALNKNDLLSLQCLLKYNQEGQISIDEIEKHCQIATLQEDKKACMHLLTIEKHKAQKLLMTIPQSVFDWFEKTENYISSFPTIGFDQGAKEFEISGKGVRDIKSITVITSLEKLKSPCGLEVLWSDGTIDKLGLDDTDWRVTKTKVVTAPEGGYFTYVRCSSGDIVDAIAFDTEDSNGKVIRGEFIGGTGGRARHSLECFDVDHMSVVLDGIKGKVHDTYDWIALTNLSFTYRIVQRKYE